jgi:protein-disulfide isomerase
MRARILVLCSLVMSAVAPCFPQAESTRVPAISLDVQKHIEVYLRNLYAWGPAFSVKIGIPTDPPEAGFYRVPIQVTYGGQSDTAEMYVSTDGRFLMRGELNDMRGDPFASARSHLHVDGNPSVGPADARVTVVAFSDFECPHCKQLCETLKAIEPLYPQVRFVFKDFPIEQIHPWAMTAALAARCAYMHNPSDFWKVHNAIFDSQETLKADNAWDKMLELASEAGLQPESFRSCMASPEAKRAIEANQTDGRALHLASTPTVFVNGRALVGGARELLEQYINYELAATVPPSK